MNVTFGDIYLVNFEPSIGHEYKKKRPGLIIQQENTHTDFPYITIMPFSSKLERRCEHDIFVQKDDRNRITLDSVIKVHHIYTFDKSRFLHYIGRAGSPVVRQVRGHLRRHFGL